ncbi:hypothetical protein [Actinophytocola sp.]|uniref:hypothetical protein n=1 Tax=Actinophytocola sp. TaxID=1872138 RepID=UPI00389A8ED5
MAAVLTDASILLCPHGFPFQVAAKKQLLSVAGHFVLVRGDVVGAAITTCTNTTKCTAVAAITAGLSTTLAIDDDPVVLATATGNTNIAVWHVQSAAQTKLEAA